MATSGVERLTSRTFASAEPAPTISICSIASPDPGERDRAAGFAAANRFLEVPAKELPARDDDAVEDLHPFLLPFENPGVDVDGVADRERRHL
jgi:hypothetical protein